MRRGELLVKLAANMVDAERWPLLHRVGSRIASKMETLVKGVHRNFGRTEIRIATQFRYVQECYETPGIDLVSQVLREGDMAVDVGANIGIYSMVMGKLVGKTGKVHSFEPAESSFQILLHHRALNGLDDIIEAHQLLVGDRPGDQAFVEDGIKGTNRVGGSRFDGPEAKTIRRETITLDDYLSQHGSLPRLIKVDVEGYELDVLRGAENTIKASGCFILCELHPGHWEQVGYGWDDVRSLAEMIGYEIRTISGSLCERPGELERPLVVLRPIER
jgi:FkbM family methyltransferase